MRKLILAGAAIAVLASAAVAQRGERLERECRQEVRELCGMGRGKLRECLREKSSELSEGCYDQLRQRIEARQGKAEKGASPKLAREHAALGAIEHSYGSDPLQKLDFYKAKAEGKAPLLVFVHGGGWKRGDKRNATGTDKVTHYTGLGYHLASINYRLVPTDSVEEQGADVASALAYLLRNADKLGIDRSSVVLMGHSAGAHLSALVGSDPRYLRSAGLDFDDLSGVIPIDGAAYDVPAQMREGAKIMRKTYEQAFGTDPARQKALSPYWHATSPNAPAFLILHVDREDGKRQSEALAGALRKGGARVQLNAFEGKGLQGHAAINRQLGDPAYPATAVVDEWLKGVFAK
ncbi:MAG: alpha/beta hydrolase [Sphingomonadales bacterium]|nr:alpha/beta hydrolase [Sphingomonadales bacterium]